MKKYLKVMADYSSTGLWDKDGFNVEVENYNLSQETLDALKAWTNLYEINDDYLCHEDRKLPLFDLEEFSKQGLIIAKAIKRELPDFEIVYFDEFAVMKSCDITNRLIYEYPVEE
jgi:hypothetical protein